MAAAGSESSGDFDGDGEDELLMRNVSAGAWRYYDLAHAGGRMRALPLPTDDIHRFLGVGDFDGDGLDDVLFRRRDTGAWLYYALKVPGVSPRAVASDALRVTRNRVYEFRGVGDLDGDGHDDLLLRNTDNGVWVAYLMGGTDPELRQGLGLTPNQQYEFGGVGDFNGDGRDDLLLRHKAAGAWVSYEMRADVRGVLKRPRLTKNRNFGLRGFGDLNGDGRDDVLLRHTGTGEWIHYEMDGGRAILRRHVGVRRDATYGRVAVGDFDGDGNDSLLVRHSSGGDWVDWDLSGAMAQAQPYTGLVRDLAWRGAIREAPNTADGLWTTEEGRIVLELETDDATTENLLDLDGRTLVFVPDGGGVYSREVRSLAWEGDVGDLVSDDATVGLPFGFHYAGRSWDELTIRAHGLLAFGRTFKDPYWDLGRRWDSMGRYARHFADGPPLIVALYKPLPFGGVSNGDVHVTVGTDRLVVTWSMTEPAFHVHGVAPDAPSGIQAVLYSDGRVELSYRDVDLRDGIVGLFPGTGAVKGELFVGIPDSLDHTIDGHLDLVETAVYEANDGQALIVEFTTREPIPETPPDREYYYYQLYLDTDEPYWTPGAFWEDVDYTWSIDLRWDGSGARGGRVLPRERGNRLALLVDLADLGANFASVVAGTLHFKDQEDGRQVFVQGERGTPTSVELPAPPVLPDVSTPGAGSSFAHREVFHYRRLSRISALACRVVERLGDEFDLLVFHSEVRWDVQQEGSPITSYGANTGVTGIGKDGFSSRPPCEANRLKGHWVFPVWMQSRMAVDDTLEASWRFARGVVLFAHEFAHVWVASLSYDQNGRKEPLFDSGNHWRRGLHAPAAFPWRTDVANPRTTMGGRVWRQNGDGTFTDVADWHSSFGGGHSWLDLYAMGLVDASEVPDTFFLRNLRRIAGDRYTAEKDIVRIEDIIASEGPRLPSAVDAQTAFNVGFVYLVEPGKAVNPELLALHAAVRDEVIEHWARTTGERSQITTLTPP